MPIYEYQCESCTHQFEELVRNGEHPSCPNCQSQNVQRRLSTFCKKSGGSGETFSAQSSGGGKCSGCSGGSCASCH